MARCVAVYCASSSGNDPAFQKAARSLGSALGSHDYSLVYGGGNLGLMGAVSEAVLEKGGKVIGVVPYAMISGEGKSKEGSGGDKKVRDLTTEEHANRETIVVDDMHGRKVQMAIRANKGFITLPGGYGTLEEVLEVTTWSQLGIHVKPVVVLNVLGYYNPLRQQLEKGVEAGFIHKNNLSLIAFVDGPSNLEEHEAFDWGLAAINALESWSLPVWPGYGFDWTRKKDHSIASPLHAI